MLRILAVALTVIYVDCHGYADKVEFVLYSKGQKSLSTFNETIVKQGCDVSGNFSIILHGWMGSSEPWILDLVGNLTHHRGGCVIFMNYSHYSDKVNYFEVISHFQPLSKLLTRKLRQLSHDGASNDNFFIFGFSFGGRIAIEAALNFGPQSVAQIDSETFCMFSCFSWLSSRP